MKALSLWQPWASAIAWGDKCIETRSWGTSYTGPLLICATAQTSVDEFWDAATDEPIATVLRREGVIGKDEPENRAEVRAALARLPHGCVVAVATLADSCHMTEVVLPPVHDPVPQEHTLLSLRHRDGQLSTRELGEVEEAFGWFDIGRFAWLLTDVKRLPQPIPCKGAQGLWTPPAELVAQVEAALAQSTPTQEDNS